MRHSIIPLTAALAVLLAVPAATLGQTNDKERIDYERLFQQAIYQEVAAGDLAGALARYTRIADAEAAPRKLRAKALLRVASCERQRGDSAAARAACDRVLEAFSDLDELARRARAERDALEPRVSLAFTDADVRTVLGALARQSGKNIVVAADVTGTVTIAMRDVRWSEALRSVCRSVGCEVVEEDGGTIVRVFKQRRKNDPGTDRIVLETELAATAAELEAARARVEQAREEIARREKHVARGTMPEESVEDAKVDLLEAVARVRTLEAELAEERHRLRGLGYQDQPESRPAPAPAAEGPRLWHDTRDSLLRRYAELFTKTWGDLPVALRERLLEVRARRWSSEHRLREEVEFLIYHHYDQLPEHVQRGLFKIGDEDARERIRKVFEDHEKRRRSRERPRRDAPL